MGKRRRQGGGGGGAPAGAGGGALVVVNPALLQSAAAAHQPKPKPKPQAKPKPKPKAQADKQGKSKRRKTEDALAAAPQEAEARVLGVKSELELLAGVYWLLLTRAQRRNCVVVLPNQAVAALPGVPQLAAVFKHLGFQGVALHGKMTSGQRKANVERLSTGAGGSDAAAQVVLVTNEQLAASAGCKTADVVFVALSRDSKNVSQLSTRFASVYFVVGSGSTAGDPYTPELGNASIQQLQARLKLARQIADISQRVAQTTASDADNKWANKMAKGADLGESDDDDSKRKQKKKKLSPDEQRLQALSEKLYVLLAKPVTTGTTPSKSSAGESGVDAQNRKEKLQLLGLVTLSASVGTSMSEERTSAQTQWMDQAPASEFGGPWSGSVRHGASKDGISLRVRKQYCLCQGSKDPTHFMAKWRPNKQPADVDKWGGPYGKVCGHNEVVMQSLRPFFPQEVLNSKVCSKLYPAPGNQGFDGCLEHLRLACAASRSPMTVWDSEFFIHISSLGRVTWTKKNRLLSLSLAGLQCLVPSLREWTLASGGRITPNAILLAIQLCCRLGTGQSRSEKLSGDVKVAKRIVTFLLGGSARLWKQIGAIEAPLACQTVYEAVVEQ